MWTEMVPFWLHVWAVGNGGWEGMLWRQRNKHVMAVWFQLYINVGIYYSVQKWWCGLLHPSMTLSSWQEVKIQEVTTRSHLFSHCNTKWGGSSGGGGGGGVLSKMLPASDSPSLCACALRNVDVHRLSFLWLRQWCWEPCACLDEKCYRESFFLDMSIASVNRIILVSANYCELFWFDGSVASDDRIIRSLLSTVSRSSLMCPLIVTTESYCLCQLPWIVLIWCVHCYWQQNRMVSAHITDGLGHSMILTCSLANLFVCIQWVLAGVVQVLLVHKGAFLPLQLPKMCSDVTTKKKKTQISLGLDVRYQFKQCSRIW